HPHVADLERRQALAEAAAARVLGAADGGILTWSCPVQGAGARHDYYPSALMVAAARRRDPAIRNATDLRRAHPREWLARPASPLASMLCGDPLDYWEHRLREAIILRRDHVVLEHAHPLRAP